MKLNNYFSTCILAIVLSTNTFAQGMCSDGVDNDGDGLIDYLQTADPANNFQTRQIAGQVAVLQAMSQATGISFTVDGFANETVTTTAMCNFLGFAFVEYIRPYSFSSCNDNYVYKFIKIGPGVRDGYFQAFPACSHNSWVLEIICRGTLPACNNGLDDDRDGLLDINDPGCASSIDASETPHDPDCASPSDNNEATDIPISSCTSTSIESSKNIILSTAQVKFGIRQHKNFMSFLSPEDQTKASRAQKKIAFRDKRIQETLVTNFPNVITQCFDGSCTMVNTNQDIANVKKWTRFIGSATKRIINVAKLAGIITESKSVQLRRKANQLRNARMVEVSKLPTSFCN